MFILVPLTKILDLIRFSIFVSSFIRHTLTRKIEEIMGTIGRRVLFIGGEFFFTLELNHFYLIHVSYSICDVINTNNNIVHTCNSPIMVFLKSELNTLLKQ